MSSTTSRIPSWMPLATLGGAMLIVATEARALDSQWYLGFGGSLARLAPEADLPGLEAEIEPVGGGTLFVGRDLDGRSSLQLQLHRLGEARFEDGEEVLYNGGDAALLYRFADSRGRASRRGAGFGASLYGRFGLGFIERVADVPLDDDVGVHFGVGAGTELYLTRSLALRAEGVFHERDASSASLALVTRFGGRPRSLPPPPPFVASAAPAAAPRRRTASGRDPTNETAPRPTAAGAIAGVATAPLERPAGAARAADDGGLVATAGRRAAWEADAPSPPVPAGAVPREATGTGSSRLASVVAPDGDGDRVGDAFDVCPRSAAGFPVRENGCALLDGVLSGVRFAEGSAELLPGSLEQLDLLAALLESYPKARIELLAHTDDRGTLREQSILARARLRAVGVYLVQRGGVRANRLLLRSFAGTRPLYDNATAEGRGANNRIEILENAS